MEEETCMEYLFRCVLNDHPKDIDQNILFNASNEFRNLWNLVKKLRELARVDVQKITRFLDAVQEALEKKSWNGAAIQCIQAKTEYKQIRRYIRPSFLEDFKVARFIVETTVKSKSGTKKENKPSISSGNQHRRQNFRNKQINKQNDATGTNKSVTQKSKKEKTVPKQSEETDSTEKTVDKEKSSMDALDLGNQEKHDKLKAKHTRTDAKPKDVTQGKGYRENGKLDTNSTKVKELDENKSTENPIDKYDWSQNDFITEVKDGKHTAPSASFQEIDTSENNKNEMKKESEEVGNNDKVTSMKRECSDRNCMEINSNTVDEKKANNSKNENSDTSLKSDSHKLSQDTQNELQKTNRPNDRYSFKHNDKASKEVASSQSLDISSLVSERLTEMDYDCNADEIIAELKSIYDTDWTLAYKALTGCTPSNGMKNTIDFLGEILKVAAQKVKVIPENDHAFSSTGNVTSSLTKELGKFKKDFLRQHLKELQAEHSIEYASDTDGELSVNVYSAKCVELAWFMFTRQPPMTFDYDSRPMLLEDLFEIFKPYKNKGNCIHYIVWPAIRQYAGGTVVAQGIAEFR